MTPIARIAAKTVGAGTAAALLSLAVAGGLVQAAAPSPNPTSKPAAATTPALQERRAVRLAVFEAEADVLGITPKVLRADLKAGQKVSDLARDKGMTKEQLEEKNTDINGVRLRTEFLRT